MNDAEAKERGLANLIPYKKGYDPNRNMKGRPKLEDTFSDTARELLASKRIEVKWTIGGETKTAVIETDKSFYHGLVAVMIIEGMKGSIRAIDSLADRTGGRPAQKVHIQGWLGPRDEFAEMDAEARWEFIKQGYETLKRHWEEMAKKKIEEVEDLKKGTC